MSDNRWQRVEDIFHRVVELAPEARSAFLDEACAANQSLRREVESLLAHESEDGATFVGPAGHDAPRTIAHYRISGKLGQGGMGIVYRATDTKLGREVAIKVLPRSFAEDADRMARFNREAKVLASLNHPNIAQIYGIEERALVMELVSGNTLQRPLPLETALNYATQIAEALEAAHEKGIVHRDLKPANIVVTPEGVVKLLDFGLAAVALGSRPDASDPANSPTVTMRATQEGLIMGTASYMSPEQAAGKPVDKRSDIWSFGVVLYEMLTGRRLFEGETVSLTLADVMRGPIDFDKLPRETPAAIRGLLRRCLDRNSINRLRDMGEARVAINTVLGGVIDAGDGSIRASKARFILRVVATLLLGTLALIGWFRNSAPSSVAQTGVTFSVQPPRGTEFSPIGGLSVDRISPDGSMILFRASDARFHVRRLNALESEPLPQWIWGGDAFWAPDSQSIAFPTLDRKLMKMRVPKGAQEFICGLNGAIRGGSWGEKGDIIFAMGEQGLFRVPSSGGAPNALEVPGIKGGGYFYPQFLPGAGDFLFDFVPDGGGDPQVFLAGFDGGKVVSPRLLLANDTAAAFTPAGGGHLLFVRDDNLYVQKLNLKARRLEGNAELLVEHVASYVPFHNASFSTSRDGALVWRTGISVVSQVMVFDRRGNRLGLSGGPAPGSAIALAPDESRLLLQGERAWIVDAHGPGSVTLGRPGGQLYWASDGAHLLFMRGGKLHKMATDGSGVQESGYFPLPSGESPAIASMSLDAHRMLLRGSTGHLFIFNVDTKAPPEEVVREWVDNAALSPDGSWLVYKPNAENVVDAKRASSTALPRRIAVGGFYQVWRADGREILFLDRDRIAVMSVSVQGSGADLRFGAPEKLFQVALPLGTGSSSKPLAVSRDGSRFYILQPTQPPDSGGMQVRIGAVR